MRDNNRPLKVVALGGGHGLAASLSALRAITEDLTAVVCVSDDGGSSGRLREQFPVVPPGDLRMALAALCGDDEWGATWARVLQHRFVSTGDLDGHALGNLLITALWQETGDVVQGLEWVGRLLGAQGRVLPVSLQPLEIFAQVQSVDGELRRVDGQVQVASTLDEIISIGLHPSNPDACPQALEAVNTADVVVLGPGSWFTSVLAHFQVPQMSLALHDTKAKRVLVLNLNAQIGETSGYSPEHYLEVLATQYPDFHLDWVIADPNHVQDDRALRKVSAAVGANVFLAPVADFAEFSDKHDVEALTSAFRSVFLSTGNTHGDDGSS
jgi:uncharacterized cofD-like protein